jgi:hypothetical protein
MILHYKIIGIALILLAVVHAIFPKYFNWKQDLASLSLINKQMMQVHTFFIALVVLMMGCLCITSPAELLETPLGKTISLAFGVFWGARFVIQFLWYSPSLWKGKTFETVVHILFAAFFGYCGVVFCLGGI